MTAPSQNSHLNPFKREAQPHGLGRWVPGLKLLRTYKRRWFLRDLSAGAVLTTILVPVGMGYAEASGLPAICGLYATMTALVTYAIFGRSRILVLGPDSALVAIIAASVLPLAARGSAHAVELAGVLAILAGVMCVAAGLLRLGFITDLLSKPIRLGYLNAIALTVILGQLPTLLGFKVKGLDVLTEASGIVKGIAGNQVNHTAFAIGGTCLLIILACKRWLPKFPGVLLAVFLATVVVSLFNLAHHTGLSVVGEIPRGLPAWRVPEVSEKELNLLFHSAIAIALVSFADMSVVSRTFALRGRYETDDNKELFALGLCNVASGFFQGFSVTGSASRTPVAEAAGAKTQLTSVTGAICVALLIVIFPSLLMNVPHTALSAVVICACLSLVDISSVIELYGVRKAEFVACLACFLGVAIAGVIPGIFIAVGISLLVFIIRASRPYSAVLGRAKGLKGYHDISRHPEAKQIPGLVLFRWDAPLFFANARLFRECALEAIANAPTAVKRIVIEAEPVTDIDSTAADALRELEHDLNAVSIELGFAQMKGPVKDQLKNYGLFQKIGEENFFPTLGVAVDAYVHTHQIEWHDWDGKKCCKHAPHSGPCPDEVMSDSL
ncbi:MAG TPA: sulfate permease [Candidatus Obscuribacter sp.]|nr:sulfate permease [Candidatus Obscuribacter sp.]